MKETMCQSLVVIDSKVDENEATQCRHSMMMIETGRVPPEKNRTQKFSNFFIFDLLSTSLPNTSSRAS
jgi:hypothetical protein